MFDYLVEVGPNLEHTRAISCN